MLNIQLYIQYTAYIVPDFRSHFLVFTMFQTRRDRDRARDRDANRAIVAQMEAQGKWARTRSRACTA